MAQIGYFRNEGKEKKKNKTVDRETKTNCFERKLPQFEPFYWSLFFKPLHDKPYAMRRQEAQASVAVYYCCVCVFSSCICKTIAEIAYTVKSHKSGNKFTWFPLIITAKPGWLSRLSLVVAQIIINDFSHYFFFWKTFCFRCTGVSHLHSRFVSQSVKSSQVTV